MFATLVLVRANLVMFVAVLVGALSFAFTSQAVATPSDIPGNAAVTDGFVADIEPSTSGVTYIGGAFNFVGSRSGSGIVSPLAGSGLPDLTSFPQVTGTVRTAVSDGSGGFYIGGTFTFVGGVARSNLAHIDASGALDPAWVPEANGNVNRLVVDGSSIFVAGSFTTINGSTRNRLAKLNNTTGAPESWTANANASIEILLVNGSDIYAGGSFSTIGGQTRSRVAKIDTTSGVVDATWNPNVTGGEVRAMALSGGALFIGGNFTSVGGTGRNYVASVSSTGTGALNAGFNATSNEFVRALAVDGTSLYVGGTFTNIGGQSLNRLAKLNTTTGLADGIWNPNANGGIFSIALSGSDVYVTGIFSGANAIGGEERNFAAKLNNTDGAVDGTWNPQVGGLAHTIAVGSTTAYIGGTFVTAGADTCAVRGIARILTSGQVDCSWNVGADGTVLSLKLLSNQQDMIVAGGYGEIGGESLSNLAKVDVATQNVDPSWNPNTNSYVSKIALSEDENDLYAGGGFNMAGGQVRNNLAKLSVSTGAIDSNWNPNSNSDNVSIAYSAPNSSVYVSGYFTNVGGQPRNYIAKLSDTDGSADLNWNPNPNGDVTGLYLDPELGLLVGGGFSGSNSIGGVTRNHAALLDPDTGAVDPTWNPDADFNVNAFEPGPGSASIYAGGVFTQIGGQTVKHLAKLDRVTGAADPTWTPQIEGDVQALGRIFTTAPQLYAGGNFSSIGTAPYSDFAVFEIGSPDATITPTSHSYGSHAIDSSTGQDFTVTSTGDDNFYVDSGALFGTNIDQFSILNQNCNAQLLPPGDSCTVNVGFTPTTAGAKSAFFGVIGSTAVDTVPIDGTATGSAVLTASPTSHNYGSQAVGSSTAQQFTVTNSGNVTATVGPVATTGSSAALFRLTADSCSGQSIAVGASCAVAVAFSPTAAGSSNAAISVPSSASDSPLSVPLSGSGTGTPAVVCPKITTRISIPTSGKATRHRGKSRLGVRLQARPSGAAASVDFAATATARVGGRNVALQFQNLSEVAIGNNTARRIGLQLTSKASRRVSRRTPVTVKIKSVATPLITGCPTQEASTTSVKTNITKLVVAN